MKRLALAFVFTTLAMSVVPITMAAGIPQTINLQGRFTDAAGNNVADGVHTVDFKIWREPVAGALLWSETLPVQVTDGLFTVVIGNSTPIPADLFAGANRYLGVTVDAEPEMPRIPLNSVAYSYQAQDADVATLAVDLTCVGCVSASEVDATEIQLRVTGVAPAGQYIARINQNGTVSTGVDANNVYTAGTGLTLGGNQFSISPSGVTGIEIASDAVGSPEIATDAVGALEILAGSVGSSEIATGAVTRTEVLDGTLTADDMFDEPGVASNASVAASLMDGTVQTLLSRAIVAPAAGYVLVIATAEVDEVHNNGTIDEATFGVSTTAGVFSDNQQVQVRIPSAAPSGTYTQAVTVHGIFSTSGGSATFYFLGNEGFGSFVTSDLQLTVIYFPTAYGTVVSTGAASGGEELSTQGGEPEPILFGPVSETIQPTSVDQPVSKQELAEMKAEMEARIQQLEASIRGGLPEIEQKR